MDDGRTTGRAQKQKGRAEARVPTKLVPCDQMNESDSQKRHTNYNAIHVAQQLQADGQVRNTHREARAVRINQARLMSTAQKDPQAETCAVHARD